MRTDAEKRAFAVKCLEIEKEGGDVLGYIRDEYPSYTPRATWYNLQKWYLSRYSWQLTEGRPINPEERRLKELRADKAKQLDEILKVLEEGKDPIEYLEGLGYKAPTQVWTDLKNWARKNRPDDRKKMPDNLKLYYADHGIQRTGTAQAIKKPVENPSKPVKAPETIFFGGKEYEKLEGEGKPVNEYRAKPSPTCCQPARESGVTLDDMPLEIVGIMSNVKGYYQKSCIENKHLPGIDGQYVHLIWRDLVTHDERSLGLSVSEWLQLAEEIPKAMRQLGFMKP